MFEHINYKGKEVVRDVDATTHIAFYKHVYRTDFTNKYREHACVAFGHWCWDQIIHNPRQSYRQWRARRAYKRK